MEVSGQFHGRFTPRETGPGTLSIEGWALLRAGLDAVDKWKILPLPWIELGRPAPSP
jgi:hypothetical protein